MYRQITILTVLICFLATPALAAQMSVEPAYQEAFQGDNITVNITVDPEGSEVYGASYILYFNNTVLNATSQVKGPFLTQDGAGSIIYTPPTGINNSIGQVEYVETRSGASGGVTDPGVLTTITFQVIGEEGISSLNLGDSDGILLSFCPPIVESIPTTVNNGRVGVAQASTPFQISGNVSYGNGSDYINPAVSITNLNTGVEWTAETNESSNYYQILLASCSDVIAGEILQFNVTSPDRSRPNIVTEQTVTQAEVDAGGFEYNITLKPLRPPGDVNGDGKTTPADAAIALQMAVCSDYNTIADVNHDNSITSLDALMILQVAEEL